ncbi:IPT/TIG domain-containing protein [Thermococcus piezophilus]|uniref:IPT/TIG domain-containing protein n=1 Tax=Thermococcus piezophilus TaxID=1712654 RepID=UPI000ACF34FF|nr:IPT/TIG domain-containing protein [Thermococcus piezophilus]
MMVFNNTTEAARIIRTLAALRKTNDALAFGDFRTIYTDYNVWAFERAFGSHRLLVVLNNGPEKNLTLSLNWSDGTYRDALYGADMVVNRGKALVTLPRNSFYMFHIEDDQNEPLIGSVTPYIAQPGQKILIAGAGFGKSGTVFIGGEKARIISWNWSQILVEVPRLKTSDAWVPVYVEVDGKDSNRVKLRYYSENEIPALVVNGSNLTGGLRSMETFLSWRSRGISSNRARAITSPLSHFQTARSFQSSSTAVFHGANLSPLTLPSMEKLVLRSSSIRSHR